MKKVILVVVLSLFSLSVHAEWYEGGSLHNANAIEWQQADDDNKLATAGDLIAAAYQKGMLKSSLTNQISGVDDIRPLAEELMNQLDAAFEPESDPEQNQKMYANQKVNESAAMLLMMMGWVEL